MCPTAGIAEELTENGTGGDAQIIVLQDGDKTGGESVSGTSNKTNNEWQNSNETKEIKTDTGNITPEQGDGMALTATEDAEEYALYVGGEQVTSVKLSGTVNAAAEHIHDGISFVEWTDALAEEQNRARPLPTAWPRGKEAIAITLQRT